MQLFYRAGTQLVSLDPRRYEPVAIKSATVGFDSISVTIGPCAASLAVRQRRRGINYDVPFCAPSNVPAPVPAYKDIEQRSIDAKKQFDQKQSPGADGLGILTLRALYVGVTLATLLYLVEAGMQAGRLEQETFALADEVIDLL